eukprot:scaffold110158_cov21-Tisochrysis_lutea.AAC.2
MKPVHWVPGSRMVTMGCYLQPVEGVGLVDGTCSNRSITFSPSFQASLQFPALAGRHARSTILVLSRHVPCVVTIGHSPCVQAR